VRRCGRIEYGVKGSAGVAASQPGSGLGIATNLSDTTDENPPVVFA
jgi:hypothetical protein